VAEPTQKLKIIDDPAVAETYSNRLVSIVLRAGRLS
jgi:hypothetical protein